MRLLDARFKYTPSTSTNIVNTWRRFGYRPTTAAERQARQQRRESTVRHVGSAVVTRLQPNKQKAAATFAPSGRGSAGVPLPGEAPADDKQAR